MSRATRFAAVLLMLVGTHVSLAQSGSESTPPKKISDETHLPSARNQARARFDATTGSLPKLREAKRDAIRLVHDERYGYLVCGRGNEEFWYEAAVLLVETDLTLCSTASERMTILERHWMRSKAFEELVRSRFDAGRIDTKTYLGARYYRMEAELRLAEARAKHSVPVQAKAADSAISNLRSLDPRELARAKFEALQVDVKQLRRAMRDDARDIFGMRMRNIFCGRGSLPFALPWLKRLLECERALAESDGDRVAALEQHWIITRALEDLYEIRYQAGRVPIEARAQSRDWRLEAEIWLAQSRTPPSAPASRGWSLNGLDFDYIGARAGHFALLAESAGRNDPRALTRERLDAVRENYEAWEGHFVVGRGSLDLLLDAASRLVDLENSVAATDAERRAAFERHWQRLSQIESINRARLEANRILPQDYQLSRFRLLEAEEWLLQVPDKPDK